jgi:hypothetical protein
MLPIEPNWPAALIAGLSSVLLTLFGVDYYALMWGLVGACLALTQLESMSTRRALIYVALSTLIGAALGTTAVEFFRTTHRAFLITGSLVGGAGAQVLVGALLQLALTRIKKMGGADGPTEPSR